MADELKLTNETKSITPQCKIVVYSWNTNRLEFDTPNSELSSSFALDISSQLESVSYNKNMANPSGSFQFTLTNSPGIDSGDWKDIIKRGSWCVIYMSNDGDLNMTSKTSIPNKSNKLEEAKKIRCIGYIDRVAVSSELNDKGAFDVTYEVSGRDFGVVYEDTSIWHNLFYFDQTILNSLVESKLNVQGAAKVHEVLDTVHDLFYNPKNLPGGKAALNDQGSLTSIALQWLLPKELLRDIGVSVSGDSFWGSLNVKRFSPTAAGLSVESPLDYLSGNAWEQLKKISVPELHELFTETNDSGLPGLTFRPIPFAIDKSKYPLAGENITLYKDLSPIIIVPAIDVIGFNLGEDNHSRYNSFLATVATTLINVNDNITFLKGTDYPKNIQDSIKRHGFRPMHVTVDSIIKNAQNANGEGDAKLLLEFNEVLYDYWNNAVFQETGSVTMIGNNLVKLGKVLKFNNAVPYVNGKRYYIEGYSDSFTIDEKGAKIWIQEVHLTRGFSEKDLTNKSGFGERDSEFINQGEFTSAGVAQTGKGNK